MYIHKYQECTSLIQAVGKANLEIVKELLQHGADVNVKDNSGQLHIYYNHIIRHLPFKDKNPYKIFNSLCTCIFNT